MILLDPILILILITISLLNFGLILIFIQVLFYNFIIFLYNYKINITRVFLPSSIYNLFCLYKKRSSFLQKIFSSFSSYGLIYESVRLNKT